MANGLIGGFGTFGQGQQQQQGNLLGGVLQPQPTRGQRRAGLISNAIQQYGGNAQQTGGAAVGSLLGLAGRAAAEKFGLVDAPPEVQRAEAIRQVQQEAADKGLNIVDDPRGFGDFVAGRFQELGQPQLAARSLLETRQIEKAFAPEPVETEIRFVGGTPRAKALQQRYPQVGQVEDGQEITLRLLDGDFRGVSAGDAPEEETAPSRIREYELALERGLINPDTSLEEYNQMRAGGGRSSVTPTETQLKPYAAVISSNENINERIKSFVEDAPESTLLGLNIPFTGGRDQDAVDAASLQVQQRAAEIRSDNAELTIEQALDQAIDELSQVSGEPTSEGELSGGQAGTATPENDPYAGRVNP